MRILIAVLLSLVSQACLAISPDEIIANNTHAVVYLEVTDSSGGVVDHGTGFIVSHDGYIITVAHLKVTPTQQMWAIIGQKSGVRFQLSFRETDEASDMALWQLPQSASCRYAVILSTAPVKVLDRVLALGFPANEGLTPSRINITNLSSASHGFYKADGFLRPGNSGGPVFNESGQVIAIVQGGTLPGTDFNDLVPIAPAITLIKKRGVRAGIDKAVSFDFSCYASCPAKSNGVESWAVEGPWSAHTGWLPGGHNQGDECKGLIARDLATNSDSEIILSPGSGKRCSEDGNVGMCEEIKEGVVVQYMYFCKGTIRSGPTYVDKPSPACGLWN
jgi:Trypsin-like peptidase domain